MVYDEARQVTMAYGGGTRGTPEITKTWLWNGQAWTQLNVSGPGERWGAQLVYDSQRQVCVLYGDGDENRETWEWDGSHWNLRATTGPPPTVGGGMAYDRRRGRTVLFGGKLCSTCGLNPANTWEWDGNQWTMVSQTGPSRRDGHSMAYDEVREVTVLFGGEDNSNAYLGDTWLWDGTTWTEAGAGGPIGRSGYGMAWDANRRVVVLFGGGSSAGYLSDTWEWDGAAWTQRSSGTPSGRTVDGFAYDRLRRQFVLHGGRNQPGGIQETWLLKFIETWIDPNYLGTEQGSPTQPFRTLAPAVTAAPAGSELMLKPGTFIENITITKPLSLFAPQAPATIQGH
jgi:hypothetical protein